MNTDDQWVVVVRRVLYQLLHMLRVDVEDWNGRKYFAEYSRFYIDSAATLYKLRVFGYKPQSTAGDSLRTQKRWKSVHNGQKFSTYDQDNDKWLTRNCAAMFGGMVGVTLLIQPEYTTLIQN